MSAEPKTYRCCDCCPRDPGFHADNPPDSHDVPCETCYPSCGHDVERIRRDAKAEALTEAADDMERIFRAGNLLGGPTDDWLRLRAAEIDPEEGDHE